MGLFSQRRGLRPAEKTLQRECVDDELRNGLWSAVKVFVWDRWSQYGGSDTDLVMRLLKRLWVHYFKESLDALPRFDRDHPRSAYEEMRGHFFGGDWWAVYDFLEFTLPNIPEDWAKGLASSCNDFLQSENAAYRIVGNQVVEITDDNELAAVDEAQSSEFDEVRDHLTRALELLSDRKNPDYRNSIKESISAVEAIGQRVTGKKRATLGDCLKVLRDCCQIHPAFEKGLSTLYGFTNDSGGIRHALTEESVVPTFADAKFMLVACSAFVNFLITRSAELGLVVKA